MSQENVELIQRLTAGAGSDLVPLIRDDGAWAAFEEAIEPFVQPDCQVVAITPGLTWEYSGVEGFREGWLDWLAPWASYRQELEEPIDLGDRIVILGRERGRLVDTDSEVETRSGAVYYLRNGKIARAEYYLTRGEALEAVGLSEQDAHADS
jgi:ketosteroid isomerase-like protein